jgi:hypothetical protein
VGQDDSGNDFPLSIEGVLAVSEGVSILHARRPQVKAMQAVLVPPYLVVP